MICQIANSKKYFSQKNTERRKHHGGQKKIGEKPGESWTKYSLCEKREERGKRDCNKSKEELFLLFLLPPFDFFVLLTEKEYPPIFEKRKPL